MKLDHNCLRSVLLKVEGLCGIGLEEDLFPYCQSLDLDTLCEHLPEFKREDIFYTLKILQQAGLIDAESSERDGCTLLFCVLSLTAQGHEYLEKIRDNRRWSAIKSIAGKLGDASLKTIAAISEGFGNALLSKVDFAKLVDDLPVLGK